MGVYINPEGETKEDWLHREGRQVFMSNETLRTKPILKEGRLTVVLVDNGLFTAAAVMFDKREQECFSDPRDHRPRWYFEVSEEKLFKVCPDLKHYLIPSERGKRNGKFNN